MSEPTSQRHSARETRLLLLTLAVSVAALLLLARFRFPERPLTDLSPPQPLTRLTRVTAFDELSAMLRDLLRQFEGAVVLAHTPGVALGLLVRDDLALVPVAPGAWVEAVAGSPLPANGIVARDEQRGLVVVRVPGYTAPEISLQPPAQPLDAPGYVAILEAAPDGPTIRAEFVSRYTTEPHAAWDQPVLVLSGPTGARPGSLLFTLSGRLVGMTLADSGRLLVVPADALMTRATRLANGENVVFVESGIDVQPMTAAIAKATGAPTGVVVSDVSSTAVSSVSAPAAGTGVGGADAARPAGGAGAAGAAGPGAAGGVGTAGSAGAVSAAGAVGAAAPAMSGPPHISVGDIITTAAGRAVRAPRDWQQTLRAQAPGATLRLSIVRFGKPLQASLTLPRPEPPPGASGRPGASGGEGAAGGGQAGGAGGAGAAGSTAAGAAAAGGRTAGASPQSPLDVMGLSLRGVTGDSEVIAVRIASPAARAGLRVGDRITSLPGRAAGAAATSSASPNAIATACAELASGQALLLAIDRDGESRVAALEKP